MSKFKDKGKKELPPISTSSLPDVIFMLLFFFLVSTTIRKADVQVKIEQPREIVMLAKLEKKNPATRVYIGLPKDPALGTEPRVQIDDNLVDVAKVQETIVLSKESLPDQKRPLQMIVFDIDKKTQMGIVDRVTLGIRKANVLRVMYLSSDKKERRD